MGSVVVEVMRGQDFRDQIGGHVGRYYCCGMVLVQYVCMICM